MKSTDVSETVRSKFEVIRRHLSVLTDDLLITSLLNHSGLGKGGCFRGFHMLA